MDLLLTDYDMDLTNGDLSFINGAEAIGQDVTMRLRTWLGETVYDQSAGVPYTQVIFAERNPNLNSIQFILEQTILNTPGMLTVELDLKLDRETRTLAVTGSGTSIDGEIDFSTLIEAIPTP
jgi:hypothetical protein